MSDFYLTCLFCGGAKIKCFHIKEICVLFRYSGPNINRPQNSVQFLFWPILKNPDHVFVSFRTFKIVQTLFFTHFKEWKLWFFMNFDTFKIVHILFLVNSKQWKFKFLPHLRDKNFNVSELNLPWSNNNSMGH